MFVPVNEPLLCGNEKKYLNECIDTGWISSEGPFIRRFEQEFARLNNRAEGIAVTNGTAALDIAVRALGIGSGDQVIMPAFTIISCASAIVRAGAEPVLVDSDVDSWNMDVSKIEAKINHKTRAIMVVHIYGLPVDMEPVLALAKKYQLAVIEDAAQAIGLQYRGKPCGSFGDISTFSFYPNKHITCGEGGMVLTDNKQLAERCRSLRNLCFQEKKRFIHEELGWNYRMSNIQAAIGLAQLERLPQHLGIKQMIANRYNQVFATLQGVRLPLVSTDYAHNNYWIYGLMLTDERDAEEVMTEFSIRNVGTRPFFWPMHEQPVLQAMGLFRDESYPVSENLARRGFYLPSGLGMTTEQQQHVIEQALEVLS